MSVFLLPDEISKDIERMMTKFWWQSSMNDGKGIHWMAWHKLGKHKKGGGMGFRDLRDFNLALLGKQGWCLLTRPHSLATKVFKARYFADGNFLSAKLGSNPSFVWQSIFEAQDLVLHGVRWCVGDGTSISVLGEPWLPDPTTPMVVSSHPSLINTKVANLMTMEGLSWDEEIIEDLFEVRDQRLIKRIPLNVTSTTDHIYWTKEALGYYTVKSAYSLLQKQKGNWFEDNVAGFWNKLWSLQLPPKVTNLV
ncbi:uncharacterized mitochondrial protein AtMg00310-like [Cannabis sativa]|uniref:uncharacterized mitochondrial protein AtMg00310-like n=1 Tax=Cannabis sativa TaxID=3483 RepID=UPI0029C9CBA9|nr:uncharacterized mitochondrial protein AtMg00310-like [Cannabis sativa]